MLVYFAGWSTMINVMTVTLLGLPVYTSYASVKHGWTKGAPSGILSIVFTVVWIFIGIQGGWLFASGKQVTGHWPIGVYFTAFVAAIAALVAALWAISNEEGKVEIRAGVWILPTVILPTFLAYFGEGGPNPVIPAGIDVLIVVAFGIGTYFWAVRSGYLTEELADILRHHHEQERRFSPGPQPASSDIGLTARVAADITSTAEAVGAQRVEDVRDHHGR